MSKKKKLKIKKSTRKLLTQILVELMIGIALLIIEKLTS